MKCFGSFSSSLLLVVLSCQNSAIISTACSLHLQGRLLLCVTFRWNACNLPVFLAVCLPIYRVSVPLPTGLCNKPRCYLTPQHKIFHVLPSEKSDVDSAAGRKTPRLENQGLGGGGAIPAEAIYSTSPSRRPHTITGGSPEAMKVRLAAMVLQPPTRV